MDILHNNFKIILIIFLTVFAAVTATLSELKKYVHFLPKCNGQVSLDKEKNLINICS